MKAAALLLLCLLSTAVLALEPGERLAPWTLLDQHDVPYTLNDETRILLVARDMDGAKLVNAALEGKPKGYLDERHAVFLADISRMPSVIATLFAIPKMRDYNYRILLDRDARIAPRYQAGEGQVLWLQLDGLQIVAQQVFTRADDLRQALERQAP
ncbi:FAD/FMN-containing dehydrogenase [Ectopseudomonas oleovorans]|uniref:FAD/FMN-containing dehydrogenase n=1 Tax=Ectopseudomonas oleovorans TaxID=301 RepID=UPI0019CFBCF6|nr:FAD/FMN-containing dehydrogenase [Pseudomonas oleovorans]MBN7118890.1 FAD/FMN-containing dehydrogenase [Pseudomonas oleovorans]MBN7133939.1 FAD/FMN-containing dehydrogenase [Pseudomonas oleovorans]MBN7139330.1 FAD/FMN-containing dehydrogenase [Pseudomonas oleovorans]